MKDDMNNKDNIELKFAPGCFDEFEGTQDELAEFIAELHRLVDSGEIFTKSTIIDLETIVDDQLADITNGFFNSLNSRSLH